VVKFPVKCLKEISETVDIFKYFLMKSIAHGHFVNFPTFASLPCNEWMKQFYVKKWPPSAHTSRGENKKDHLDVLPKEFCQPVQSNPPVFLQIIRQDDLIHLSQLESISFANCRLLEIELFVFRKMLGLSELNLSNNRWVFWNFILLHKLYRPTLYCDY